MAHRIVLTGGPGAGKTAILEALAQAGMRVAPDVARDIIRERKKAGLSPRPSPVEFGRETLKRNVFNYDDAARSERATFFERGVGDSVGSLYIHGFISYSEAQSLMRQYRYDQPVFVVPPWQEIYTTDSERDQTFEESVKVFDEIVAWYQRFEYTVKEVPIGTIESRVSYLLDECGVA